jgi:predicted Zn-dependent peptidase
VKIEAIRMRDGCRTISEYEFLREREVVRNEIRRGGRSAEARIPELTMSEIYPPDHAYARPIGGDDEQLSTITLRDACEFMRQYYVPERAVVIVAGGFAPEAAIRSIETWFNTLDKRAPAPRHAVAPVVVTGGRKTRSPMRGRPKARRRSSASGVRSSTPRAGPKRTTARPKRCR